MSESDRRAEFSSPANPIWPDRNPAGVLESDQSNLVRPIFLRPGCRSTVDGRSSRLRPIQFGRTRLSLVGVPESGRRAEFSSPANSISSSARQHGGHAIQTAAIETGTKLYVSNLDYGVSDEDIKELFSEVGDLKRFSIRYDRSGRSKGTAEVVFQRRPDAVAAVRKYNDVLLDGKPLKIKIVGTNISTTVPMVPNESVGNSNGFTKSGPIRGGFTGWSRGGRGAGGGATDEEEATVC